MEINALAVGEPSKCGGVEKIGCTAVGAGRLRSCPLACLTGCEDIRYQVLSMIEVHTPEGLLELEPGDLKDRKRVDIRGEASDCVDADDPEKTPDGHIEITVYNDCDQRISARVMWGGVLGCGPSTVRTIRAGGSKTIRTGRQGPLGVCWVEVTFAE